MDLKKLLKKVGKGIVIAATSMILGVTLGPFAGAAVGSFVAKKLGEIGITVGEEVIGEKVSEIITGSPGKIAELFEPDEFEKLVKILEESGVKNDDANAALHYAMRDLQTTMDGIVAELVEDRALLNEAIEFARENDEKLDDLMEKTDGIHDSLEDVFEILKDMDRRLDNSYRRIVKLITKEQEFDFDRLLMVSKIQQQNAVLSSRYDIPFDSSLYIPRKADELVFEDFMNAIGFTERNVLLVLGEIGMGKTWFLARLTEKALELDTPALFLGLRDGIRPLTGAFQTRNLTELIRLFEDILEEENQRAIIAFDGLDEANESVIREIMNLLETSRSSHIAFVLSCRVTDWVVNETIHEDMGNITDFVYLSQETQMKTDDFGIEGPVSILMNEFEEDELKDAISRYDITQEIPDDIEKLIHKPYVLRVVAHRYSESQNIPSLNSPEFMDLFAGVENKRNTILGRLGIFSERTDLLDIIEEFIDEKTEQLDVVGIDSINHRSSTFRKFLSSGFLIQSLRPTGAVISINPVFETMLLSLAVRRRKKGSPRQSELLESIMIWKPELMPSIYKILLGFPDEVRQDLYVHLSAAVRKIQEKEIPKIPDWIKSRQEIVANNFNDFWEPLGVNLSVEKFAAYPIVIDERDIGDLLRELMDLVGMDEQEAELLKHDIGRMHPSERVGFLNEVLRQEQARRGVVDNDSKNE